MEDHESKRFGRYEVLTELGRGAMGVVYKARDPKINRIVAVKTISLAGQEPAEEKDYRERFIREAEAAGRVSHPGIVTIFDVGEEPETRAPYIVMEFVGGDSLEKLLSEGNHKMPVEKALQLALELADALECAHGQGVVHRDLKPANILMTEDGRAKIADFGVAKLNLSNQTLAGRALGTPAYMSPEQLNGDPVDGRSDLFSLGVILYTVLTGYKPFQGNSALTVSFKVVNREPIPATLLDTDLPEGLDAIINRAMAKDPAERYQRGRDMVFDIETLRDTQKSTAEPQEAQGIEPSKKGRPVNLGGTSSSVKPQMLVVPPGVATPQVSATDSATQRSPVPPVTAKSENPARLPVQASLQNGPTKQRPGHATTALAKIARNPLEKLRKQSVVAFALLAGLFILGLWVISFGPHEVRPKAAAPSPHLDPMVAAKTDAMPMGANADADAASTITRDTPSAKPKKRVVKETPKELPKASPPLRPVVAPAKMAKNNPSPIVIPVVSRAVPVPVTPATLEIEVDHKFAEANLSVWVDESLTYTHVLEGTDKKRLGVFHHVQGHEFHAMQISPGKHSLRVQVTSEAATYNQSATITGDFVTAQENVLHISFNKHGDMALALQ
jgi:serine/threonine-protein kinase